jgi:hypothetical protein
MHEEEQPSERSEQNNNAGMNLQEHQDEED